MCAEPCVVVDDLCLVRDAASQELVGESVLPIPAWPDESFLAFSPPPAAAAALSFAFRTRVAKSGLLAVPAERNNDLRFVCISISSVSITCLSTEDDEAADGDGLLPIAFLHPPEFVLPPPAGDGVGGTMTGVAGAACCCWREVANPRMDEFGVAVDLFPAGEGDCASMPSALKSGPSLRRKVSSPRRACSKSRSTRETRREEEEWLPSCDAIAGRRPPRNADGGGAPAVGERGAVDDDDEWLLWRKNEASVSHLKTPLG